jgi:hypothetical protein
MKPNDHLRLLRRWLMLYGALAVVGTTWTQGGFAAPASVPAKPQRSASAVRADPYGKFNFQVPIGTDAARGGFNEASGIAEGVSVGGYRSATTTRSPALRAASAPVKAASRPAAL